MKQTHEKFSPEMWSFNVSARYYGNFRAAKRKSHPKAAEWLAAHDFGLYYLSVITIGEIRKGICRAEQRDFQFSIRLKSWSEGLERQFGARILPVTIEIAKEWGIISYRIGNSGVDNIIAATAKVHNLIVVTRNIKHFEPSGIACVDPWA